MQNVVATLTHDSRPGLAPYTHDEIKSLAADGYWQVAGGHMHEYTPEQCWQALAEDAAAEHAHATRYLVSGPWLVEHHRKVFARNADALRRIADYARVQTESPDA